MISDYKALNLKQLYTFDRRDERGSDECVSGAGHSADMP